MNVEAPVFKPKREPPQFKPKEKREYKAKEPAQPKGQEQAPQVMYRPKAPKEEEEEKKSSVVEEAKQQAADPTQEGGLFFDQLPGLKLMDNNLRHLPQFQKIKTELNEEQE